MLGHSSLHKFGACAVVVGFALLVGACSGGGTGDSPSRTTGGTGAIQEDLSAGLVGKDTNANSIRDDIDQLIQKQFSSTQDEHRVAEQYAKALQTFMQATTVQGATQEAGQLHRAISCIFKVLPESDQNDQKRDALLTQLQGWTGNTEERFKKYLQSNSLLRGQYFSDPAEPVCD